MIGAKETYSNERCITQTLWRLQRGCSACEGESKGGARARARGVLSFGFWVSCFGFSVQGLGFRVQGLGGGREDPRSCVCVCVDGVCKRCVCYYKWNLVASCASTSARSYKFCRAFAPSGAWIYTHARLRMIADIAVVEFLLEVRGENVHQLRADKGLGLRV
jgi:hypothetical protein